MSIKGMWLCSCVTRGGYGTKKPVKVCSEGICVKCNYYAYFEPYTYYPDNRLRADGRHCEDMRLSRIKVNKKIMSYIKENFDEDL